MPRYLFGPAAQPFARDYLDKFQQSGDCRLFDLQADTDLPLSPADTWQTLQARLPAGWQPDFVVVPLAYRQVPSWLWTAPVPIVGLAQDWRWLWHLYRDYLLRCDLVLTDPAGVEVMQREGISWAKPANLAGGRRSFLPAAIPDEARDIDILFVGNIHPAVQRQRLPWLARVARLSERWRVVLTTAVADDAYRRLLARARIVLNHSVGGSWNERVFEAIAAGAVLFHEANQEVARQLADRRDCVFYRADDLETLLTHYLEHEPERRAIADAARAKAAALTFESLWDQHLQLIEQEWPGMVERAARRASMPRPKNVLACVWELASVPKADPELVPELASAVTEQPDSAALHVALGLASALGPATAAAALPALQKAWALDPRLILAGLNLAEALASADRKADALGQAQETLAQLHRLDHLDPQALGLPHLPLGFDGFRVEWERAAWTNAGNPPAEAAAKRQLLAWRLHALLADLTGEVSHNYEACLARPDLPETRAALGCALARAGRFAEAHPHLRQAVDDNPLDGQAARALYEVHGRRGDLLAQRRLAHDRRLLAATGLIAEEPWFMQAPPVGGELASIIIPCFNQLDFTRGCLESVLRHTRPPYELIIVDNGSSDGTQEYLDALRVRPGPVRVEVIRNDDNRGFPAAVNQGLARAQGRYLLLLNNDTLVTAGWLDGLIAWSLHDWPKVGLVGPVTNFSRAPQQVPVSYSTPDDMTAWAQERGRHYAGKAMDVERLTGFCLLIRREAYEAIGGLDERFGLGFFDDDDLSVRALQAGFHLLVALNVFVHHFGSKTFTALGIDCRRQLEQNFAAFRDKWGEAHAAGYALPAPSEPCDAIDSSLKGPAATQPPKGGIYPRFRVSLCIIAKNEESNLPACLDSVTGLVDEIIVVDTGSADRTKEIAAQRGAKVFDFPWVDSFAAARNESLRHASGNWVLWMDADDRLDDANRDKLRTLLADLPDANVGFVMKCLCLPDPLSKTATVVDHIRLFRNHPEIRWKYRVHEQILPAIKSLGGTARWSNVVIHHVGYQDPALRARKLQRDLRLLTMEDADNPGDPFTLFNLASNCLEQQRVSEAVPLIERSLERSQPADSIVRKLYAMLAQAQRHLGRISECLTACEQGRRHYPDDVELLFQEGVARRELADAAGAEACWQRALASREADHFASVDTGLKGYKTRHNLAVLYQEQQRWAEAESQWRAALAEEPGFLPAWHGLAEALLSQRRWQQLDQLAQDWETVQQDSVEARVLRARAHLARKEFSEARGILDKVAAEAPAALYPRVILSHVLLQEGEDWEAAEKALRDILSLDPQHGEARSNLAVLLRRLGKSA